MIENNNIKFGLLVNEPELSVWQQQCVDKLLNLEGVSLCLIIYNKEERKKKKKINISTLLFNLMRRFLWSPKSAKKIAFQDKLKNVPFLNCKVIKKGKFSQYFSESDIEEIKKYKLDFLLRFGFGIIRGQILESTTYGVWSFHHGDELQFRGSPAGFWEVFTGANESGVLLQKLTNRLDGGIVLKKGSFKTILCSYKENLDQLLMGGVSWPSQVCKDIQSNNAQYLNDEPSKTQAKIYYFPKNKDVLLAIYVMYRSLFRQFFDKLFLKMIWNVGFIKVDISTLITSNTIKNIEWLKPESNNSFIADPTFIEGYENTILLERYYYGESKGEIEFLEIDNKGYIVPEAEGLAFETVGHASYPFLFRKGSDIFMIPETSESKEVCLYKAIKYPESWKKVKVLFDDIELVDPTVFNYNERWWLLGTQKKYGSNLCLFAWYSDDIYGEWFPHNNNPIKTNVKSSRPAGRPFYIAGEMFRPSQDCSKTYGGAVVINKVLKLTPDVFEEKFVSIIEPNTGGAYPDGIHTLNVVNGKVIVDGKRHEYSFLTLIFKLKRALLQSRRTKNNG